MLSAGLGANLPGGPRLFVSGPNFAARNQVGQPVLGIAMWDGLAWQAVGGINLQANALAAFDDGQGGGPQLYAAGRFAQIPGPFVPLVARWNGVVWQALPLPAPTGFNTLGSDLTVFDDGTGPALYLAGTFGIGQTAQNGLAKWNGQGWDVLNGPMNATAFTSVVGFNGQLYVGGSFALPNDGQQGVARRTANGSWEGLGVLLTRSSAPVRLSVVQEPSGSALFIGGLDKPATAPGQTFASGGFIRYDGVAVTTPMRSYQQFIAQGGSSSPGYVTKAAAFDAGNGPEVFIGGSFGAFSDAPATTSVLQSPARGLVRMPLTGARSGQVLEGGSGVNVPSSGISTRMAMQKLFIGGREQLGFFGPVYGGGGSRSGGFALFDGANWTVNPQYQSQTFTTGIAADVGGVERLILAPTFGSLGYVAPGSPQLTTFGPANPTESDVRTMLYFDDGTTGGPVLYVQDINVVRRLVNGQWQTLNSTLTRTMIVADLGDGPHLYISGSFQVGQGVARWNGTGFERLGAASSLSFPPNALLVHDDGNGPRLYAGFEAISTYGNQQLNRIAVFDGTNWQPMGLGLAGGGARLSLASFDDGSGPALYVAGDFLRAGGAPSRGFARYKRGNWEPVLDIIQRALSQPITELSLAVLGDTLYLAGVFSDTGLRPPGAPINIDSNVIVGENIIAIRACPPACFPDLNQDGNVDAGDIDYLINIAAGGANPTGAVTDLNRDGVTDMGDVDALINVVAGADCRD
ncbi:MAG: dockerin type I repeat-containing protein [Phycisphaerales bacterium]|jgi:hypothetical protein